MILNHPSYRYAADVVAGRIAAPKYVCIQCADFVAVAEGKREKWTVDEERLRLIDGLTALMQMPPKSLKAGQTVKEAAAGYQWLLWVASLCVVSKADPSKRRYVTVLLEIARKNAKTFDIAVFFILLLLMEPKFSRFFSVAPDGKLSRELKEALREILSSSPAFREKFRIMRDLVRCKLTESEYIPLNYSNDKLDGKLPSVFLVDEVGALPNSYAIEAMQSGQLTIKNKLGCIISTKYPKIDNPFEDQVAYAKRVLDGLDDDESLFALLYEPDNTKDWMTDDSILMHANPLALEVPEIWEDLLKKRQRAISIESARENFLCKHCNIIYQGAGTETYVSVEDVRRGKVEHIDWTGREVYVGLDLAMTNDNCAVAMVADDGNDGILCDVWAFIPQDRMLEKNRTEKLDYRDFIREGKCFACGDEIVSYATIEEFVMGLEKRLGVTVLGVGFDRFNAMSTAQKLEEAGMECTIVKQHSSVLHPPTKWLAEVIARGKLHYEQNKLLEINFSNAKCTYDTNLNRFVNKRRSNGKIDMVAALLDATFLLQQEQFAGDFVIQM